MNQKGSSIITTVLFVIVIVITALVAFNWLDDRRPFSERFRLTGHVQTDRVYVRV